MAGNVMRKMAFYLGLTDDDGELEEGEISDDEESRYEAEGTRVVRAVSGHANWDGDPGYGATVEEAPFGARSAPRRESPARTQPRPLRALSTEPVVTEFLVVKPGEYAEARKVADHVLQKQPVILNLQAADRDLQRRMIDFSSGVAYAIGGMVQKVADRVFLLTPANVKVSDAERERIRSEQAPDTPGD